MILGIHTTRKTCTLHLPSERLNFLLMQVNYHILTLQWHFFDMIFLITRQLQRRIGLLCMNCRHTSLIPCLIRHLQNNSYKRQSIFRRNMICIMASQISTSNCTLAWTYHLFNNSLCHYICPSIGSDVVQTLGQWPYFNKICT